MPDFGGSAGLGRTGWFLTCCDVKSGGWKCRWGVGVLGCSVRRVEVSGEGRMVGGVLVTWGFGDGIALPVRNDPSGAK